jgi:hypothetical protein
MSPIAGTTPYERQELVTLAHPYAQLVKEAMYAAFQRVFDQAMQLLVYSAFSPIPMKTGFLRMHTTMAIRPTTEGLSLLISWPGVPYAEILIEHAGEWQFRHPMDPVAVGDFPEPSLEMVWHLFFLALCQELDARGIHYNVSGRVF